MTELSKKEIEEINAKKEADNKKINRSYDIKLKNILDLDSFLLECRKKGKIKYKNRSDFINHAIDKILNIEWKEVFNEDRQT